MYAIIENEVVTNIVIWDGKTDWEPEDGKAVKVPKDQVVSIGDRYQGGKWFVRPDRYHTWNGAAWVMTEEAQTQKNADDRDALLAQAKQAQSEANQQITVLQDRIELEDYSTEEELGTIQADLLNWKKYRIELTKFINGQIEEKPEFAHK